MPTRDLAIFRQHAVGLVFFCELHEDHQDRATLPHGWQKIGADEFQIAMAPRWTVHDYGLRRRKGGTSTTGASGATAAAAATATLASSQGNLASSQGKMAQ